MDMASSKALNLALAFVLRPARDCFGQPFLCDSSYVRGSGYGDRVFAASQLGELIRSPISVVSEQHVT